MIAACEKVKGGRVPPRSSPKKLDWLLAPSMLNEFWIARAPTLRPPRAPWTALVSPEGGARGQEREIGEVAAVERQVGDLLVTDRGGCVGVGGFHHRGFGRDHDLLLDGGEGHGEVHPQR